MQSILTIAGDIGGIAMNGQISRSADGRLAADPTVPAAQAGTLTTRTSDTAGTVTLGAGHGLVDGDHVDLYWSGGRRYNVTVGTVAGNAVPISGGAGDNLPVQDAPLTVARQVQVAPGTFSGDALVAIGANCAQRGHLSFYDTTNLRHQLDLAAGEPWFWIAGSGPANPLAGFTITHVQASHEDVASAQVLRIGILLDATP